MSTAPLSAEARLDLLLGQLGQAREEFNRRQDADPDEDPTVPHYRREGAVQALGAVMGYLYDIGVPTHLRLPLDDIHAALADADNGRVNALTKPRRLPREKGHHGKPIFDTMRLANASAAVTLMHRAGAKIEIACRRVARHLPYTTAEQLKRWREDLTRGKKSAEARRVYDTILTEAGDMEPARAADLALEVLKEKSA